MVRARHPLEGQALPVLGWMRRHGKLDLILVLPDGSRSLIPAAWTALDPSAPGEAATLATLGSIADLLHAGRVLDGIIQSDSARPDDGHISNLEGAHAQPAVGARPRSDAGARTAPLAYQRRTYRPPRQPPTLPGSRGCTRLRSLTRA